MFSLWIIVILCGVAACPHPTTTPSIHPTTTPHPHSSTTPNTTTINMTTKPPIYHKSPKRCPTKAALIADFISKSKYHFKALQYDHQGYYKALKWNLDMAFKSLEGQFGNLIADVQYDVKDQFTNIQKENDALKTQIIALKSKLTQNMSAVKDEVKTQNTALKQQITDGLKTLTDDVTSFNPLKTQIIALKSQLTQNMSAVKDEVKTQNTALKQQITDGLKTLTDHVTALNVQQNVKNQFTNIQKENNALKTQIIALKSQLTQNMSAVKDEVKTQNTALKQQITDGLKTLTDDVTALIDECATHNAGCAHTCTDTPGIQNHICTCHSGYQLMANGHNCTNRRCNPGEFSVKGGWFSSPNHPSNYLDDTNCTFIIRSPPNTRIRVVYTAFHTEGGCHDYVELRSRSDTLLNKKCGTPTVPTPPITTTDNYLKVHFHSDSSWTASGYKATCTFLPV